MKTAVSRLARPGLLTLALAVALVSVGSASTVNGTLNVSAIVAAGACTVDNSTLSFGSLSFPLTNGAVGVGTITVNCASGVPYAIDLSDGAAPFGRDRRLAGPDGASFITYNLYTDQARSQPWGSGVVGGFVVSGRGSGAAQPVPVYGFIPTQAQPAVQGVYTDTVVISVVF